MPENTVSNLLQKIANSPVSDQLSHWLVGWYHLTPVNQDDFENCLESFIEYFRSAMNEACRKCGHTKDQHITSAEVCIQCKIGDKCVGYA